MKQFKVLVPSSCSIIMYSVYAIYVVHILHTMHILQILHIVYDILQSLQLKLAMAIRWTTGVELMAGAAKIFSSGLITGSKQIPLDILKSTTVILLEYALIFGTGQGKDSPLSNTVSLVVVVIIWVITSMAP